MSSGPSKTIMCGVIGGQLDSRCSSSVKRSNDPSADFPPLLGSGSGRAAAHGDVVLRSIAGVGTSAIKLTLSTRRYTVNGVEDPARLLVAYDDQLRTDAETPSAVSVTRHGPMRLIAFAGGRGFITYRNLGG